MSDDHQKLLKVEVPIRNAVCNPPRAIAVGFFYASKGSRRDVLRLEIDLKGTSQKDRKKAVGAVMKLADKYGFCK